MLNDGKKKRTIRMKNILLLAGPAFFLAACAGAPSAPIIGCGADFSGHTETKLYYETDDISMKWKTKAGRKSEFWIKLQPSTAFRPKLVTIVGVEGELPGGAFTSPVWLNTSGRWTTQPGRKFVLCIPDVPIGTEYKFDVVVEDIGTLDPRLEVTY